MNKLKEFFIKKKNAFVHWRNKLAVETLPRLLADNKTHKENMKRALKKIKDSVEFEKKE